MRRIDKPYILGLGSLPTPGTGESMLRYQAEVVEDFVKPQKGVSPTFPRKTTLRDIL